MSEHAVRLRATWEAQVPDEPEAPPFRVDLPLDWERVPWPSGLPARRLRLVRRFGRPVAAPGSPEPPPAARLVLTGAAGTALIEVNGEPTPWRVEASGAIVVELPELGPRNVVAIEVEPPRELRGTWGEVAIVFGGSFSTDDD